MLPAATVVAGDIARQSCAVSGCTPTQPSLPFSMAPSIGDPAQPRVIVLDISPPCLVDNRGVSGMGWRPVAIEVGYCQIQTSW